MLAWIILLVLIAAEVLALRWWLHREFYPIFFSGWAALLYAAVLAGDFVAAWLVSMLYEPGGTTGTATLALTGICALIITLLFTLFFRWVVRTDMTDPPRQK